MCTPKFLKPLSDMQLGCPTSTSCLESALNKVIVGNSSTRWPTVWSQAAKADIACFAEYDTLDSVQCNFEEITQCGYRDISEGSSKWLRMIQPGEELFVRWQDKACWSLWSSYLHLSDGNHSLVTVFDETSVEPAQLLSPPINMTDSSCILMNLSITGSNILMKVFSWMEGSPLNLLTIVDVNAIYAHQWKALSVMLPLGEYRLLIAAYGCHTRLLLREVIVAVNSRLCGSAGKPGWCFVCLCWKV